MMDFKVEYLPTRYATSKPYAHDDVAYVRLAAVEKLIQEAEKFAKNVVRNGRWQEDEYIEAQGFLHRIAAWWKTKHSPMTRNGPAPGLRSRLTQPARNAAAYSRGKPRKTRAVGG